MLGGDGRGVRGQGQEVWKWGGGGGGGEGARKGRRGSLRRGMKVLGKKARMKRERKRRVDGREALDGIGRWVEKLCSSTLAAGLDVIAGTGFAELRRDSSWQWDRGDRYF